MTTEPNDKTVTDRQLQILRAVAYCWYRQQECYWARLKRMLPEHSGDMILQDVHQLVSDGFLKQEERIVAQGRIRQLTLTEDGWVAFGQAEELLD